MSRRALLSLIGSALLAACGGGDDPAPASPASPAPAPAPEPIPDPEGVFFEVRLAPEFTGGAEVPPVFSLTFGGELSWMMIDEGPATPCSLILEAAEFAAFRDAILDVGLSGIGEETVEAPAGSGLAPAFGFILHEGGETHTLWVEGLFVVEHTDERALKLTEIYTDLGERVTGEPCGV